MPEFQKTFFPDVRGPGGEGRAARRRPRPRRPARPRARRRAGPAAPPRQQPPSSARPPNRRAARPHAPAAAAPPPASPHSPLPPPPPAPPPPRPRPAPNPPQVYASKHEATRDPFCKYNDPVISFFVAALFLAGIFGAFLGSWTNKWRGRRPTMMLGGCFFLLGAVLMCAASHVAMLVVGRVSLGVGVGICVQCGPLFLSELAPYHLRGMFNVQFQVPRGGRWGAGRLGRGGRGRRGCRPPVRRFGEGPRGPVPAGRAASRLPAPRL
jgi:hypothetical protein